MTQLLSLAIFAKRSLSVKTIKIILTVQWINKSKWCSEQKVSAKIYNWTPKLRHVSQNYHSFPMLNAPASFGKKPWFLPAPGHARLLFYSSVRKQNVSEVMPWSAEHSGVDLPSSLKLGMPVDHGYWSSPQQKMDKMSLPRGVCGFWRVVECHGKPQLPPPAKPCQDGIHPTASPWSAARDCAARRVVQIISNVLLSLPS